MRKGLNQSWPTTCVAFRFRLSLHLCHLSILHRLTELPLHSGRLFISAICHFLHSLTVLPLHSGRLFHFCAGWLCCLFIQAVLSVMPFVIFCAVWLCCLFMAVLPLHSGRLIFALVDCVAFSFRQSFHLCMLFVILRWLAVLPLDSGRPFICAICDSCTSRLCCLFVQAIFARLSCDGLQPILGEHAARLALTAATFLSSPVQGCLSLDLRRCSRQVRTKATLRARVSAGRGTRIDTQLVLMRIWH